MIEIDIEYQHLIKSIEQLKDILLNEGNITFKINNEKYYFIPIIEEFNELGF
jgi:hypothetical protein